MFILSDFCSHVRERGPENSGQTGATYSSKPNTGFVGRDSDNYALEHDDIVDKGS